MALWFPQLSKIKPWPLLCLLPSPSPHLTESGRKRDNLPASSPRFHNQRLYNSLLGLSSICLSPDPVPLVCRQSICKHSSSPYHISCQHYSSAISLSRPKSTLLSQSLETLLNPVLPYLISPMSLPHINLLMVLERLLACLCLCSYCSFWPRNLSLILLNPPNLFILQNNL